MLSTSVGPEQYGVAELAPMLGDSPISSFQAEKHGVLRPGSPLLALQEGWARIHDGTCMSERKELACSACLWEVHARTD